MMRRSRRSRLLVVAAVLVCIVAAIGAAAALGDSSRSEVGDSDQTVPAAVQTNTSGQTYGVLPDEPNDPVPDFVRVVATNGRTGYCREADMLGPCPDDPEENTKACLRGHTIPVFASDGTTGIGEFVVGGPGSEAVYGGPDGSTVTMTAREDGTIVTTNTAKDGHVLSRTLEALDGTITSID